MSHEGYSSRNERDSPTLQLVRWAFSNPEKIAAVGFGLIAFGLSMFYFESRRKDKNLEKRADELVRKDKDEHVERIKHSLS